MLPFHVAWTFLYPGIPRYTESQIPSQRDKVFIVTGGNSGIGFELVKILYAKGAKVYMASRSQERALPAIKTIEDSCQSPTGEIRFLRLDLDDLVSVKIAAAEFAAKETRLDVLWNNAGIGLSPVGSTTQQGIQRHMGVNCVGHLLFSHLLLPQLRHTAATASLGDVRVVWTSSQSVDAKAPPGGVRMEDLNTGTQDTFLNYAASKAGNWLLASEFSRHHRGDGILSLTQDPGVLSTGIWCGFPTWFQWVMVPFLHPVKYGAYTEAWAGLSPDVTMDDSGRYASPWGRWHSGPRKDIEESLRTKQEGGTGIAQEFWDWCQEQIKPYTTH